MDGGLVGGLLVDLGLAVAVGLTTFVISLVLRVPGFMARRRRWLLPPKLVTPLAIGGAGLVTLLTLLGARAARSCDADPSLCGEQSYGFAAGALYAALIWVAAYGIGALVAAISGSRAVPAMRSGGGVRSAVAVVRGLAVRRGWDFEVTNESAEQVSIRVRDPGRVGWHDVIIDLSPDDSSVITEYRS
jgi:hypothetical protein